MIFREYHPEPLRPSPEQNERRRPTVHLTPAILAFTSGIVLCNMSITGQAAILADQFAEVRDAFGEPAIDSPGETWGAGWGDLDGDRFPDLWLGMHQFAPSALFQNNRNGTFSNVIDTAVIDAASHYPDDTHGVAWADFDNDGDDDLLEVSGGGAGKASTAPAIRSEWRNNLFVNSGGLLNERAQALGIDYPRARSRTPLWMDYDEDGKLDVIVAALSDPNTPAPSSIFRQASGGFVETRQTTAFNPGSCHSAMTSHLGPNGEPAVICGDTDRITRIYRTDTLPFTDLKPTLGTNIFEARLFDIAIGDFNGDLAPDVFGGITPPNPPMVVRTGPGNDRIHAFIPGTTEQGFSFSAPGDVQIEFGWETARTAIFLGSAAVAPPLDSDKTGWLGPDRFPHRVKFTLSKTNPSHVGLPTLRTAGVYIGFTGTAWEVRIIKPAGGTVNLLASAAGISSPTAIGAVNLNQGNMAAPALFLNQGGALVRRDSTSAFLDSNSAISTYARSVVAGDFDNDMDLDVYVGSSGKVANVPNLLFENQGDATFRLVANAGGAAGDLLLGRTDSATLVDFDQDGFLDLFVTQGKFGAPFSYGAQQQLFRNKGNQNHWVLIDLEGVTSNRDGVGAVIHASTSDGKKQMREQNNGVHRYVQDYAQTHFGLGNNRFVDIDVFWPSGIVDTFTGLAADRIYRLVEGTGVGGSYSLSVNPVTVSESAGLATFNIVLSRAPGTGQNVTVNYKTSNRAALAGVDYSAVSGILTFNAGEVQRSVSVPITNDAAPEGWEAFALTLTSAVAEPVTVKGTIKDDDEGSTLPLCGKPNYDKATETAVFVWNDCETNVWHIRGTGGGKTASFQGTLSSAQTLLGVVGFSLESGDILALPNFAFNVPGTTQDGFDFQLPPGAEACFHVTSPDVAKVLIGSNRVPSRTALNLPDYGTCTSP